MLHSKMKMEGKVEYMVVDGEESVEMREKEVKNIKNQEIQNLRFLYEL